MEWAAANGYPEGPPALDRVSPPLANGHVSIFVSIQYRIQLNNGNVLRTIQLNNANGHGLHDPPAPRPQPSPRNDPPPAPYIDFNAEFRVLTQTVSVFFTLLVMFF